MLQMVPIISSPDQDEIGLTIHERNCIMDELKAHDENLRSHLSYRQKEQSSHILMLLMVFRFFLQSGESDFFVKRLRNLVKTKLDMNVPIGELQESSIQK